MRVSSWPPAGLLPLPLLLLLLGPAGPSGGGGPVRAYEIAPSMTSCGGRLTAQRGVIATPNFPRAFPVPIRCRWIIGSWDFLSSNGSITVHLTQLYVYKGLTFTEYAYYESETANYGPTVIAKITEGNIHEFRQVRTYQKFLVIDFHLDRLEGNHVRVLDHLLDVYGFNVTYEMTQDESRRSRSCSLRDCSYNGDCLLSADYASFSCKCFDQFAGKDCADGPLCYDEQREPVCLNDGVCKQIGDAAMECDCPPGCIGNRCELLLPGYLDNGCPDNECVLQCPYSPQDKHPCDCRGSTKVHKNRSRYECKVKLSNIGSIRTGLMAQEGLLENVLSQQLTRYLKSSRILSLENLKILSVTATGEVVFDFFGNSTEGDKIREALNRLVQHRRLGDIALESTHFTFQQKAALRLLSLRVNDNAGTEVRLGDPIHLECMARGSHESNFAWYKDGMPVNVSKATRDIRVTRLPNDGSDVHSSVLGIARATMHDSGQYTCQVVDWAEQQCRTVYVEVKGKPEVKVIPMSATIEKGGSIQLTCVTPNVRGTKIGAGWTKNRALLKLEPGSEVWEDVYPVGSILKISNAQKSAIYTCNIAQRSVSVRIEVVNRTSVPICPNEESWDLQWPGTRPGSEALLPCPKYFLGPRVSRLCAMRDATTPEWQIPDFSGCLFLPFRLAYNNFQSLTLGYQNTSGSVTVEAFWKVLEARSMPLYPGEGDLILGILAEIEQYQKRIDEETDLYDSGESLARIIDKILKDDNSVLDQQKVSLLLKLMRQNVKYLSKQLNHQRKQLVLSSVVLDVMPLQLHKEGHLSHDLTVPMKDYTYPGWYSDKISIRLWKKDYSDGTANTTISLSVVVYKNLSRFLPTAYFKELNDGSDLEYRINSRVVTVSVPSLAKAQSDERTKLLVNLQLQQLHNLSGSWNISCGFLDSSGTWDLETCVASSPAEKETRTTMTSCMCPNTGTFALFLTTRAVRVVLAKKEQTTFIIVFGCGSCLLECILTSLVLACFWWKDRTWLNFLKIQCCSALAAAMSIFVYAVHNDLPESSFSVVAIVLEAVLLIALSAPVSQAMIVYAEITNVRPSQHLQPTVIAVITGVPVLAVLSTELTHKSTGWRHESWWLIYGSGVYTIFIGCATILLLIFALLYAGVLSKARAFVEKNFVKREAMKARLRTLHRAAVVICGIATMEASSILYINSSAMVFHYSFATLSSLLGFVVLVAYVTGGDVTLITPLLRGFKWHSSGENVAERASQPIKAVCGKGPGEPPCGGPTCTVAVPATVGTAMTREGATSPASCSATGAAVAAAAPSGGYAAPRFPPGIRCSQEQHGEDINLENYSTSPRKYQEFPSKPSYRELGMARVGGQVVVAAGAAGVGVGAGECSAAKVLCSADVEASRSLGLGVSRGVAMPDVTLAVKSKADMSAKSSGVGGGAMETLKTLSRARERTSAVIPDIANTAERKQPDGEENAPMLAHAEAERAAGGAGSGTGTGSATSTGMLDRISHDLDYLLNRNKEEV